jgi:hypothetical protein
VIVGVLKEARAGETKPAAPPVDERLTTLAKANGMVREVGSA